MKIIMQKYCKFLFILSCIVACQWNCQLKAAPQEELFKNWLAFGNLDSPIEVYYFSNWECSTCGRIEPIIAESGPEIAKSARIIFVDLITNQESIDFTPYNLSFMMHNKPQYLQLRGMMNELSKKTKSPKDADMVSGASSLGASYRPLSYSETTSGIKYFKYLARQFHIDSVPTVVVVNSKKQVGKKFVGSDEITVKNILSAIESLKQGE